MKKRSVLGYLVVHIFLCLVLKVLGKCQLKEAVQEKEGGLDSLGNDCSYCSKRSELSFCCDQSPKIIVALLFSSGRWIKLEHGTKTVVLFGASSTEEKSNIGAR